MHNFTVMICFPNAKINIGLNILARRQDGFHEIETVFYPLGLSDLLEFIPVNGGSTSQIQVTGLIPHGMATDNLVFKAFNLLHEDFRLPSIQVHLHKLIPSGAGLGGGSSDAAHMIHLLVQYFQLPISSESEKEYASRLGSDCAFFLFNKPAIAGGRGEMLKSIELSLAGYHLLLVKPTISVNTREAYAGIQPRVPATSLQSLIGQPISNWNTLIKNDFEEGVFQKYPEIGRIKNKLLRAGALYASMSGSGSAVYGIFNEKPEHIPFPDEYFQHYELL
jgi:4-diphosphocytidyl-2-C-methyl-D-erythritol kinase